MHIDDLFQMIDDDIGKPLRRDLIDWEAGRNQALHQKYRKILYYEKLELERMKSGLKVLSRHKIEYYTGKADPEVYKEKPFDLKVKSIKSEVGVYLDSDSEMIEAQTLVSKQAEKVELLRDTLSDISKRTFSQQIILNTQRFKHGLDSLNQIIELGDPENAE